MSDALIDRLKAMAHPLRFRILKILSQGERNVGEIEDVAGIGQPALSQQLSVLRKAGLVETRKEAKLVYYKLSAEHMEEVASAIGDLLGANVARPAAKKTPVPGAANFARLS